MSNTENMLHPLLMSQRWPKLPHQCSSLGTVLDFPSKWVKCRPDHQPPNAASCPRAIKDTSCQSQRHILWGSPHQGEHPLWGSCQHRRLGLPWGEGSLPVRTPQYLLPHRQLHVPPSLWVLLWAPWCDSGGQLVPAEWGWTGVCMETALYITTSGGWCSLGKDQKAWRTEKLET